MESMKRKACLNTAASCCSHCTATCSNGAAGLSKQPRLLMGVPNSSGFNISPTTAVQHKRLVIEFPIGRHSIDSNSNSATSSCPRIISQHSRQRKTMATFARFSDSNGGEVKSAGARTVDDEDDVSLTPTTNGSCSPETSRNRSQDGSLGLLQHKMLGRSHSSPPENESNHELVSYARDGLDTTKLPTADTLTAQRLCSLRMQNLVDLLEKGADINPAEIIKNLKYSKTVLDAVYQEDKRRNSDLLNSAVSKNPGLRRLFDDDDVLDEVGPDAVPTEVREWLALTFTKTATVAKVRAERPKFKSVANAIRAGIMVDRIFRRISSSGPDHHKPPPPEVARSLERLDVWDFDIWELNKVSENRSLRYIGYELIHRQGLISKLKINSACLDNFLSSLEVGYSKFDNPYHNLIHGADVAHTTYYLLHQSNLTRWLTDVEVFACIIAALIHDYEHTGTTNNFHIMTGSRLANLYNDKSVLENHHISAAFELMRSSERNIISGLKREQYKEFRSLVIDMVLATDMSSHFTQIKNMKSLLSCPENIEKSKVLSLVIHAADIAHPSKLWRIHKPWTDLLMQEFFNQGDKEKEQGLPCSPLCDRNTTPIAESQVGFINIIVQPTMNILGDMLEKISQVFEKSSGGNSKRNEQSSDANKDSNVTVAPPVKLKRPWEDHLKINREKWAHLAAVADEQNNNHTTRKVNGDDRSSIDRPLPDHPSIDRPPSDIVNSTQSTRGTNSTNSDKTSDGSSVDT